MKQLLAICFIGISFFLFACGDGDDGNTAPAIDGLNILLGRSDVNYEGPIFDWHQHLPFFQNKNLYSQQLFAEMNSLGVPWGVLMGAANDAAGAANYNAVFSLQEAQNLYSIAVEYPETFTPFFAGFDPADPASVNIVQNELTTKNWKGLGELHLRSGVYVKQIPANHPVMMQIYNLAAEHGAPVHLHYQPDYGTTYSSGLLELENALEANPNTIFVWGHWINQSAETGGLRAEVKRLLNTYSNLYLQWELKFPPATLPRFLFNLEAYNDRIIFGSDVGILENERAVVESGGPTFQERIDDARSVLGTLSLADARNIAFINAKKLLGADIERDHN